MAFLWHLQRRVANPATIATATSTSATESGVVRTVVGASKTNTGIAGYRGHHNQNHNHNHVRGFYSSCSRRNAAAAAAATTTTTTTTSTTTTTKLLRGNSSRPHLSLFGNSSSRCLSFYENGNNNNNNNNNNPPNMGSAAYVVYGEEVAFGIKAIPPEFRVLPSGTVILDNGKRGRFLFEWTPVDNAANTGAAAAAAGGFGFGGETANTNAYRRFRWDATTRFALTAEEAASLLARLDRGDETVEFSRRLPGEHPQNPVGRPLDKVFVAKTIRLDEEPEMQMQQQQQMQEEGDSSTSPPMPASSSSSSSNPPKPNGLSLLVDYVDPDQQRYGQIPHPITGSGAGGMYDATEGFV
eukprot:jgi/Psemu1/22681/gm1.22681_g